MESLVMFHWSFDLFDTVKSEINDDDLASLLKKCYHDKIVHLVIIEQNEQLKNQAVKIIIKVIVKTIK
jgi:hypothetical protein